MDIKQNTLVGEKSPYLQQHGNDPIQWLPWGEESLTLARRRNRLIFLSIGYSTCHWCHVMGRESFLDEEVAHRLNESYIPILVDCEERPDINQLYMKACRTLLEGNGGWPLNIILSPDQVPVFAAVYLPVHANQGRSGLIEILDSFSEQWRDAPDNLVSRGQEIIAAISDRNRGMTNGPDIDEASYGRAADDFRDEFDFRNNGFGPDPRFIRPHALVFLLRRAWRCSDAGLLAMVEQTLEAIRKGGITDHIGGGVHRYSTDVFWRIPHFEKMLYDQAGLILACIEAYTLTGRVAYAASIVDLIRYVLRDLTNPEGVFHAGEDADIEGEEGRHFIWTRDEVIKELGTDEGKLFCWAYGISAEGNFRKNAAGQGTNVPCLDYGLEQLAAQAALPATEFMMRMERARNKLLCARRNRPLPHQDTQVIVSWNALMISALAMAGQALSEPGYLDAAEKAAQFILIRLRPGGRLCHCLQECTAHRPGFAADHVFFTRALLDLYQATFNVHYLEEALRLAAATITLFFDEQQGGLFETADDAEELILRLKEIEEREMPSTNAVALEVFARLWLVTGDRQWQEHAFRIMKFFAGTINQSPHDYPWFLQATSWLSPSARKVVIAGDKNDTTTTDLITIARRLYLPDTVILFRSTDQEERDPLVAIAPSLRFMEPVKGRPTAFICQGQACMPLITDPAQFKDALQRR